MARKSRKNIVDAPVREVQKPVFYAGAYIRLSVVDRKNKGDSLENQQAIINSFIAEHDNIELREIYIDNGHSGQSFERPAFLRMIADMESGKINCCITKDLSRLGRNAIDSGYYIERHFPAIGVRYIAVTDDYDSADGQSGGIIENNPGIIDRIVKRFGINNVISFKKYGMGPLHYGNTEGSNIYEGEDLLVIGTPYQAEFVYKLFAFTIGLDFDEDAKMKSQLVTHNGYRFWFTTYEDEVLRNIHFWMIESELEQAVGRARLLRYPCTVTLFSNYPLTQAKIIYDEY